MKKQISLITLIGMMISVTQPAWSMEEEASPMEQDGMNGTLLGKRKREKEKEKEKEKEEETNPIDLDDRNAKKGKVPDPEKESEDPENQPVHSDGTGYFDMLPVEMRSLIVLNDFLSPKDLFNFALTCRANYDLVFNFHPTFRKLELFLSERGYFDRNDGKATTDKIGEFYQTRRNGDPRHKLLMAKFFIWVVDQLNVDRSPEYVKLLDAYTGKNQLSPPPQDQPSSPPQVQPGVIGSMMKPDNLRNKRHAFHTRARSELEDSNDIEILIYTRVAFKEMY